MQTRRILVAPLDWGLGHASRCVPLIRRFLEEGNTVTLAGSGASGILLREHFHGLRYFEAPGYAIRYPAHGNLVPFLGLQLPGILRSIRREHAWLNDLLASEPFDQIISDNRYGLWHPEINSILLTHQLALQLPASLQWAQALVQRRLTRWFARFDEIWVPDRAGDDNLGGRLSHPTKLPAQVKYIGPLSRFSEKSYGSSASDARDIVVVLSGPEPQRSMLEALLVRKFRQEGKRARLITGQPGQSRAVDSDDHIEYVNHLSDEEFARSLLGAGTIYCRSGYSSLMDLDALGLKAILIPTPGQTEQEYLAEYFSKKGWRIMRQAELAAEVY